MKQTILKKMQRNYLTDFVAVSRSRLSVLILLLTITAVVVAVVQGYNCVTLVRLNPTLPPSPSRSAQKSGIAPTKLRRSLSFQPEADRFRRRIGQRFITAGRERSVITGALSIGSTQYHVRIVRIQQEDGEQVEISLNGGPAALTWNGRDGAKSAGRNAISPERSLIERLALDSPDQFVLAQTRGASYYTVARGARPEEALGRDDYSGPIWDVVQIGEPQQFSDNRPESPWRLYLINTSTGLIDKVSARDSQGVIEAELAGWSSISGEMIPTQITWRRDGQQIMQLIVSGAEQGPKN